jgi:hypothetical protein
MSIWYRLIPLMSFAAAATVSLVGPVWAEFIPPDPLDKLWEQHMLVGKSSAVSVSVKDSTTSVSESTRKEFLGQKRGGSVGMLHVEPYGISVGQSNLGFWGTGGWYLQGGLLDQVVDGTSNIQLYAKQVTHLHSHFPYNKNPQTDTGYEFFLLHRNKDVPMATIVRKWDFPPQDIVRQEGMHIDHVRAFLTYDPLIQAATVKITGLTRPFEEQVDLSSVIQSGQQELPASGEGTK